MYFIVELQIIDGQPAYIVKTSTSKNEALSEYYNILHYAAISSVTIHSCVILDERGNTVAKETFTH